MIRCSTNESRRTFDALLRLADDHEDAAALIAVFEENREAIAAAVDRWLGPPHKYSDAPKNVLLVIGMRAADFDPHVQDPRDWISQCADSECKRLRLQIEAAAAPHN